MAKSGPKPMPAVVRDLRGNPGRRPTPPGEIYLPACVPDPPEYLSPEAVVHWIAYGKQLDQMGVMTEVDLQALAMLCEATATYWDCNARVQEAGLIIKMGSNDYWQQNPYWIAQNKAEKQISRLLAEFGLTPSSRTRVRSAGASAPAPGNRFSGRGQRPA